MIARRLIALRAARLFRDPLLELDRWALHAAVGAEDTAITGLGSNKCMARTALEEIDAGVRGHRLLTLSATLRAGNY
jgi:hypothetical protein